MQFGRGQLDRRDAMDAERNEEEPNLTWSPKSEGFPAGLKLNLLRVHRVSAVSFGLPLPHRVGSGGWKSVSPKFMGPVREEKPWKPGSAAVLGSEFWRRLAASGETLGELAGGTPALPALRFRVGMRCHHDDAIDCHGYLNQPDQRR